MNIQYVCELYFDRKKVNQKELVELTLDFNSLGFSPNLMSIYVTENEIYEEVDYDEELLFSILSKDKDSGITIIKHKYDESVGNPWFKLGKIEGEFFSLQWSNESMNFLLQEKISNFLKTDGFAACYIFDNKDVWEQSNRAKEEESFHLTDYPGIFKHVCGMQFMAAPLMWFGSAFFDIISQEKFLKFNNSQIYDQLLPNLVHIRLFDLYDSPAKEQNREKQKQFWAFFELDKVALTYEQDHAIDAKEAIKNFLNKRRIL